MGAILSPNDLLKNNIGLIELLNFLKNVILESFCFKAKVSDDEEYVSDTAYFL